MIPPAPGAALSGVSPPNRSVAAKPRRARLYSAPMTTHTPAPLAHRRAALSRSAWLFAAVISILWTAGSTAQSLIDELAWAYAITPGTDPAAPVDDGTLRKLPGTDKTFKLDQIRN